MYKVPLTKSIYLIVFFVLALLVSAAVYAKKVNPPAYHARVYAN